MAGLNKGGQCGTGTSKKRDNVPDPRPVILPDCGNYPLLPYMSLLHLQLSIKIDIKATFYSFEYNRWDVVVVNL